MTINRWVQGVVTFAVIAILAATIVPGAAAAPPAQGTLEWDAVEPVTGSLDARTPSALYMFPCTENFPGSLVVETTSGNLAAELTVVGPGFQPLGTSQPAGDSAVMLETFMPASTGICQAEVRRTGDTSGNYAIKLRSGYGTLKVLNTFDQTVEPLGLEWKAFETNNVKGDLVPGAVQVTVKTANMFGYFVAEDPLEETTEFFMQADVAIQNNPSYAEYGLVWGMSEDGEIFYSLSFSTDGDYSLYAYDGGWTALREWTVNEAIDGAEMNPRIAIWLHGGVLSVFWNGAFIEDIPGVAVDTSAGYLGISGGTIPDQTDQVVAQFDNFLLTTPYDAAAASTGLMGVLGLGGTPQTATATPSSLLPVRPTPAAVDSDGDGVPDSSDTCPNQGNLGNGVDASGCPITPPPTQASGYPQFLDNWAANDPAVLINELQAKGLVPLGGSVQMRVPTTYGETSRAGFNYYPLGSGSTFDDLVLTFDATLVNSGPGSGCGMHYHATSDTSISALVFEDTFALFAYYGPSGDPDEASFLEYTDLVKPGVGVTNRVTIISIGVNNLMYVNGELLAAAEFPMASGTTSLEMYVESDSAGATQLTYCQLDNVWLWSF